MRTAAGLATALTLAAAPLALVGAAPARAAAPTVTVTAINLETSYRTTDGLTRMCNVSADLYVPSDASATHLEPAILTTNGFGGSKADQASLATEMGALGYITLSYSGLGFGGSGCPITDDDPDSDGQVATQLVSFLGGAPGIGYTTFDSVNGWAGAVAAPPVQRDTCDHAGHCGAADTNDPRLGMIGGSYGGQIQFAAAGDDPRIDTIVPLITWHDLSYSLDPGNIGDQTTSLASGLPGVGKTEWDNFFFGLGVTAVAGGSTSAPGHAQAAGEPQPASATTFGARDAMCPGFQPETCTASAETLQTGAADATAQAFFTHSSVTSYLDRIHVPVFLGQGQHDTLFNLHEAAATYTALKERGIPVKMDWQSWGHSQIGAAPGEYPYSTDDATGTYADTYQGQQFLAWFDHYLRGDGAAPSLDFEFFRDWAYAGTGTGAAANEKAARAAYGVAPAYPVTGTQVWDLSGTTALVPAGAAVATGAAGLTAVPGGRSSFSITDAVGVVTSYTQPLPQPAPTDAAGSFASWTTPALTNETDVVGIPTLDVTVMSGEAQTSDVTTQLVLFAKVYDVSPSAALTLPARVVSPVRVPGVIAANTPTKVHIALPGIVQQFPAGDQLQVVLASGDSAYAGNMSARTVTFPTSADDPGVLTLPVVPQATDAAPVTVPAGQTATGTAPAATGTLASTGLGRWPLVAAGLTLLGAVAVRRRRSA